MIGGWGGGGAAVKKTVRIKATLRAFLVVRESLNPGAFPQTHPHPTPHVKGLSQVTHLPAAFPGPALVSAAHIKASISAPGTLP